MSSTNLITSGRNLGDLHVREKKKSRGKNGNARKGKRRRQKGEQSLYLKR